MFGKILIAFFIGIANLCFAQSEIKSAQVKLGEGGMSEWFQKTMELKDSELKTLSQLEAQADLGGQKLRDIAYKRMMESNPLLGADPYSLEQMGSDWYIKTAIFEQSMLEAEFADLLMRIQANVNQSSSNFKILEIENISYVNKMKPYDTQRDIYQLVQNNYEGEPLRLNGEYGKFLILIGNEKNQYYISIHLRRMSEFTLNSIETYGFHDGVVQSFKIIPRMIGGKIFNTHQRDVLGDNEKLTETISRFLSTSNSFSENFSFIRDYESGKYSEIREYQKAKRHQSYLAVLEEELEKGTKFAKELGVLSIQTKAAASLGLLGMGAVAYLDLPGMLLSDLSVFQQVMASISAMSTMFGLKILLKLKTKNSLFYQNFHDILIRSIFYTGVLVLANNLGMGGLIGTIVFASEYYFSVFNKIHSRYEKVKAKYAIRARDQMIFDRLRDFIQSFERLTSQKGANSIEKEARLIIEDKLIGNSCRKSGNL